MLFDLATAYGRIMRDLIHLGRLPLPRQLKTLYLRIYPASAIAVTIVLWVASGSARSRYRRLLDSGAEAEATITWSDPGWRGRAGYAFDIGPRRYHGIARGSWKIGSPVRAVFVAGDPEMSCVCDPKSELRRSRLAPLIGGLWLGLLAPPAFLSAAWLGRKNGGRQNGKNYGKNCD